MSNTGINLVSEEVQISRQNKEKERKVNLVFYFSIIFFILGLGGILGTYLYFRSSHASLISEQNSLITQIAAQKKTEDLLTDLDKRSSFFSSVIKKRLPYSQVVTLLAGLLPQEVVLETLEISDDSVSLSGSSLNYAALAKFIEDNNLRITGEAPSNEYPFSGVVLRSASLDNKTGTVLFELSFEIDSKVNKEKLER